MENGKMEKMEKITILDILFMLHIDFKTFNNSFLDSFIFEIIFGKLLIWAIE